MTPAPAAALSIEDLLPLLSRDVIDAIADRPHEPEIRRLARAQAAMRMIEAFEPEDGVEIMLAGQTVLMQNLAVDSIHDSRRATTMDGAYRHRQQAMALGRVQLSFLKEISLHRAARPQPVEEALVVAVPSPHPPATSTVAVKQQPPPQNEAALASAVRPPAEALATAPHEPQARNEAAQAAVVRPPVGSLTTVAQQTQPRNEPAQAAVMRPPVGAPAAAPQQPQPRNEPAQAAAPPVPPRGEAPKPALPQAQFQPAQQVPPSAGAASTRPVAGT